MGICYGEVDELPEIKAGDRHIWIYDPSAPPLPPESSFIALEAWQASGNPVWLMPSAAVPAYNYTLNDRIKWPVQITGNQTVRIKAAIVFGGDDGEGGIEGTLDVMFGAPDQPVNSKLQSIFGGLVPAYRKRFTVLFDGMICALSKYPKAWAFRVRRNLKGWDGGIWYSDKCRILLDDGKIHARNGAHIIYECLTNRDWGKGHNRAKLDDVSFRACADVLYAENFGLCLKWLRQDKIGNFIQIVLNHIGANLFVSRTTGLWTLRLVRNDYDVNTIPHFDADSGLLGIDEDDNAASVMGANELVVNYVRPADNSQGSVRVPNPAAVRGAGGVLSETVDYPGIPTPSLALRVGERDMRSKFGIKKFKIRLDRRGYKIEPGGVFSIAAPERGIEKMVLRAGKIQDGALSEGIITISAAMDVFGLPANSYAAVQPPLYTPPSITPLPVEYRRVGEATYRDLVGVVDPATFEQLTPGTNLITAMGSAPTGWSIGYQLDTRIGSSAWKSTDADFTPTALIATAIPPGADQVAVGLTDITGLEGVVVGTAALINDEIFRVTVLNLTTNMVTLARGCVDTVPAQHAAGSRIWFYESGVGVDKTEYAAGLTLQVRMLTKTGAGKLNVEDAPIDSHTITQRRERAYPPGNVKLNDIAYPSVIRDELSISWSHRDRVLQADQLIDTSVGNVGPEPGTAYKVKVTGEAGALVTDVVTDEIEMLVSEFGSSVYDEASTRTLRVAGVNVLSTAPALTLAASLADASPGMATSFNPCESGYLYFSAGKGEFIDGTTGAKTTRNRATNWQVDTRQTIININPSTYVAGMVFDSYGIATEVDSYNGYALIGTKSGGVVTLQGGAAPDTSPSTIRDRRSGTRCAVALTGKTTAIRYWVTSYGNHRTIRRQEWRLHKITKSQVLSGPVTSTSVLIDGYWLANPAQFEAATGFFGEYTPASSGRMDHGNAGFPEKFAQFGVIFGGLLYVPYLGSTTAISTSGKPVAVTNILTTNIDCAIAVNDRTAVYTIDLDGNFSLIATRTELVLADQVNATQGIEIAGGSMRVVNSSTGAIGGVIATLPAGSQVLRVVGDPTSETFYVLASNGYVYRYNLTGTLLNSIQLPTSYRSGLPTWLVLENPIQLEVSAGFLYVVPEVGFQGEPAPTYRINKNLTEYTVIRFKDILGTTPVAPSGVEPYRWYLKASPASSVLLKGKLIDENGTYIDVIQAPTSRMHDTLTVELSSTRSGLDSHQKHTVTTHRRGYGLRYGESYED